MKNLGISYGWIIEGFCILPSISINWMWKRTGNEYKRIYDLDFKWLLWYFTVGQISNYLKECGY